MLQHSEPTSAHLIPTSHIVSQHDIFLTFFHGDGFSAKPSIADNEPRRRVDGRHAAVPKRSVAPGQPSGCRPGAVSACPQGGTHAGVPGRVRSAHPDPLRFSFALTSRKCLPPCPNSGRRLLYPVGMAANALGLTTQVPVRSVYLTSGVNRKLRLGGITVEATTCPSLAISGAAPTGGRGSSCIGLAGSRSGGGQSASA